MTRPVLQWLTTSIPLILEIPLKFIHIMLLILMLLSLKLVAQEPNQNPLDEWESVKKNSPTDSIEIEKETAPPPVAKVPAPKNSTSPNLTSRELRKQNSHSILVNYSLIDTWIPGKYGVSYAYTPNPSGSWELEYLRGSLSVPFFIEDLGRITDQRLTLMYRSFSERNSFSFIYGANYSSFKLQLGPDYLAAITGGNASTFDVVSVETLGLTWGLGNRWQMNKATVSFDWFVINIPVIVLESEAPFLEANATEQSKKDIRDVLDIIEGFPTFALLKFQLGFSF